SVRHRQGTALIHWKAAKPFLKEILSDPDYILIGHNIAYDLAVAAANHPELLPLIFQAFEENRIRDTLLRQKLLDIAVGIFRGYHAPPTLEDRKKGHKKGKWVKRGYSLDECNYYYTKKHLEKDLWRKKYGELRRFPLAQWP